MSFQNINVLYVRSGLEYMPAYNLISTGIESVLKDLVATVTVVNPQIRYQIWLYIFAQHLY